MKRLGRILICIMFMLSCLLVFFIFYYSYTIPNTYKVFVGQKPRFNVSGVTFSKINSNIPTHKKTGKFVDNELYTAKLFNFIPIKDVLVKIYNKTYVFPCGTPFGVKFLTDGVMVVNTQTVPTILGEKNPSREAGVRKGDILEYINDEKICSNKDLKNAILKSSGNEMKLIYNRNFRQYETSLRPVFSCRDNKWQTGLLVRDSSAGIGTFTFCTYEGVFGGLGHAVYDIDTGKKLPLGSGEIVRASIESVKQGICGSPGELCGEFARDESIGNININTDCGLYGKLNTPICPNKPVEVGFKQEVKLGNAYIYCTVEKDKPKQYSVVIESIDMASKLKNLVVKITDKKLLNLTGGIVQGMSGSPILQCGKIIGAITHVFLNDPTRGYGVFAETMLEVSDDVLNNR